MLLPIISSLFCFSHFHSSSSFWSLLFHFFVLSYKFLRFSCFCLCLHTCALPVSVLHVPYYPEFTPCSTFLFFFPFPWQISCISAVLSAPCHYLNRTFILDTERLLKARGKGGKQGQISGRSAKEQSHKVCIKSKVNPLSKPGFVGNSRYFMIILLFLFTCRVSVRYRSFLAFWLFTLTKAFLFSFFLFFFLPDCELKRDPSHLSVCQWLTKKMDHVTYLPVLFQFCCQ